MYTSTRVFVLHTATLYIAILHFCPSDDDDLKCGMVTMVAIVDNFVEKADLLI